MLPPANFGGKKSGEYSGSSVGVGADMRHILYVADADMSRVLSLIDIRNMADSSLDAHLALRRHLGGIIMSAHTVGIEWQQKVDF